jgi:hypothetical protein
VALARERGPVVSRRLPRARGRECVGGVQDVVARVAVWPDSPPVEFLRCGHVLLEPPSGKPKRRRCTGVLPAAATQRYTVSDSSLGRLVVQRHDVGRLRTVAVLDSQAQVDRFLVAIATGADEVAALQAVDAGDAA